MAYQRIMALWVNSLYFQVKEVNVTGNQNEFMIQLQTNAVAPFVWLEASGIRGRFSDIGFLLMEASKNVVFYAWEPVYVQKHQTSLTMTSLMDMY